VTFIYGVLKDRVYRTNPHTKEELRKTYENKFWKFLRKNLWVNSNPFKCVESVYMYKDSIFRTSYNISILAPLII
jgi:hypothetical protein